MYGPMMNGWDQMGPWMLSMHLAWMLLPLIAVVLSVVAIVVATNHRQDRKPPEVSAAGATPTT
jgi:hypothetical protein